MKETSDVIIDLTATESEQLKSEIIALDQVGLNRVGSDLLAYFEQEPKIDFETALKANGFKKSIKTPSDLDAKMQKKMTFFLEGYDEKGLKLMDQNLELYFNQGPKIEFEKAISNVGVDKSRLYNSGFSHFAHKIPTWIFILFTIFITIGAIINNLSLIPTLGLLSCLYMMSQVELKNWIAFVIWLIAGLIVYFIYSRKNSKLNTEQNLETV